jgi:hypothetical protein
MMSTLESILVDGRLGPIALGSAEDSMRDLLGEPDDVSLKSSPKILRYGNLELAFFRGEMENHPALKSIHVYFDRPDPLPAQVTLDGWWPSNATSPAEFRRQLETLGIPLNGSVSGDMNQHLVTNTGARITFDDDRLHSIHRSSPRSETRQITVVVPKDEVEIIGQLARQSNLSVAALCSRWISEQVNAHSKVGTA